MNTNRSMRAHINALAAATAIGGVIATASTVYANNSRTMPNDPAIAAPHQGPGIGSTKTPPFYDAAYVNQKQSRGKSYFHTTDNQAAQQPVQPWQGPGQRSSKAPGIH